MWSVLSRNTSTRLASGARLRPAPAPARSPAQSRIELNQGQEGKQPKRLVGCGTCCGPFGFETLTRNLGFQRTAVWEVRCVGAIKNSLAHLRPIAAQKGRSAQECDRAKPTGLIKHASGAVLVDDRSTARRTWGWATLTAPREHLARFSFGFFSITICP